MLSFVRLQQQMHATRGMRQQRHATADACNSRGVTQQHMPARCARLARTGTQCAGSLSAAPCSRAHATALCARSAWLLSRRQLLLHARSEHDGARVGQRHDARHPAARRLSAAKADARAERRAGLPRLRRRRAAALMPPLDGEAVARRRERACPQRIDGEEQ